jgi:two-component system, sensor histidine kinase YesM
MNPCTISVSIQPAQEEGYLRVVVEDNGPGISEEKLKTIYEAMQSGGVISNHSGNGMAISNVHKRLELYYPNLLKNGLTIDSEVNAGTKVSFEIPVKGDGEYDENHLDRR